MWVPRHADQATGSPARRLANAVGALDHRAKAAAVAAAVVVVLGGLVTAVAVARSRTETPRQREPAGDLHTLSSR